MFLSDNELKQLTGKTRHSAQIRWLQEQGWKFTVNALGEPVVMAAEASRHLLGGARSTKGPNWEALNGSKKAA